MRIAVDARELSGRPTGVGRYLAGLVREWAAPQTGAGHDFLLYAAAPVTVDVGRAAVRVLPGGGGTWWEQRTLPAALAADRPDVLFSPAYSTPILTRLPRVLALHDLSFIAHPEWFHWREGGRRRSLARLGARAARAIVTISEFSKGEIVSRLGVPPGRIHVIPPGIDAPPVSLSASRDSGVHLLYVGSIFNRRHIPDLIRAFDRLALRHEDAHLHLVGDNRSYPHQDIASLIAAANASTRMHWHRYVSDADLQQLYRQARGFVFLSEYEGLGLTPLEALAARIPSLLLDTPVARESCGDAALYVHRGEPTAIAQVLEQLLYDDVARRALLTAAPAVLARYDWGRAAAATLRVLEAAA